MTVVTYMRHMLRRVLFKLKRTLYRVEIVQKERSPHMNACSSGSQKRRTVADYVTHMTVFASFDINAVKILYLEHFKSKEKEMDRFALHQFKPPTTVRGMMVLDKTKFDDTLKVPAITVPVKNLQKITKHLKKYGLKLKGLSPVVDLEKSDPNFNCNKKFLMDPRKIQSVAELLDEIKEISANENICCTGIEEVDLKLSYDNWNFHEIMQAVMPDNLEGVAGYSEVGHIAHFNLREQALPFKHIIGEVLLDKSPALKTVVNKLRTIHNTYRTFNMEVLAGENNFVTQTRENGCVFELDFSKVYWNSRLGTEHHRITKGLKCTDIVFDVFAGIGPFAIPAAKKRAIVFANDLNPLSYESLLKNIKLNSCDASLITCSNLDGKEFIQTVMKDKLRDIYTEGKPCEGINTENLTGISILMNLPDSAYTFLDTFNGLLSELEDFSSRVMLPTVHCYCFTNLTDAKDKWDGDMHVELKHRVIDVIGGLKEDDIVLRVVRDVAPQKIMMCVSFRLTSEILRGRVIPKRQLEDTNLSDEQPAKCQKLETISVHSSGTDVNSIVS